MWFPWIFGLGGFGYYAGCVVCWLLGLGLRLGVGFVVDGGFVG